MHYYQVEFKNPNDFLKTQTEDFIMTNRLLLFKEDDAYYLFSKKYLFCTKNKWYNKANSNCWREYYVSR